mgnify:CR=1 FL=1
MPNITIRDVPEPVHRKLAQRAERNGQSLQQYVLARLTEMTETLTMDEWLEQVDASVARQRERRGGAPPPDVDVVSIIHDAREERDARIAGL